MSNLLLYQPRWDMVGLSCDPSKVHPCSLVAIVGQLVDYSDNLSGKVGIMIDDS